VDMICTSRDHVMPWRPGEMERNRREGFLTRGTPPMGPNPPLRPAGQTGIKVVCWQRSGNAGWRHSGWLCLIVVTPPLVTMRSPHRRAPADLPCLGELTIRRPRSGARLKPCVSFLVHGISRREVTGGQLPMCIEPGQPSRCRGPWPR
jgi:hypothetical protein